MTAEDLASAIHISVHRNRDIELIKQYATDQIRKHLKEAAERADLHGASYIAQQSIIDTPLNLD